MKYYSFNLVREKSKASKKNADDLENAISSAVGEVNNRLDGKAFVLISSIVSKGKRLRGCAETMDYSMPPESLIMKVSEELGIDYEVRDVSEITLSRFDSLAEEAFCSSLANGRFPQGPLNSDDFNGIFCRGLARESIFSNRIEDRAEAEKAIVSWKHITGFEEEISRIFQSNDSGYRGNPVHYAIEAEDAADRSAIRNILIPSLIHQNRIILSRLVEIKLDTIANINNERLSSFMDLQEGGVIIVSLYKSFESGDALNAMHQAIDDLASLIRSKKRKVLFIFELSKKGESTWKYMKSQLRDVTFIELKERNLTNKESITFLEHLASADNIQECSSLQSLIDEAAYGVTELKQMYSSWYDRRLSTDVYPAYSDIPVADIAVIKEKKGSAYRKLSKMIGLDEVRNVIMNAIDYARVQSLYEKAGVAVSGMTRHMVFSGNPGTAKTTCARLYASIMKDNGLLSKGHLVEVGRQDIVSKYLGGTAPLVKEYFEKADGGVLFIDEAYSLVDDKKGLYGDEAINTLVQEMENHRDSVVVILAGYPDEMDTFLSRNPGLRSRIGFHIHFRDYTVDELLLILKLFVDESGMILDPDAECKLCRIFEYVSKDSTFGNGRFARNLFEQARLKQASRILKNAEPSEDMIKTLVADDFTEPERKIERRIGFAC